MKLNDLKYFIEVAAMESLSRAAERLGISQPALSINIKRLEEEVGITLFNRYKTGVKLTLGGKQLLQQAKKLIQLWEDVKYSAYEAEHKIEGQFIFGCHPSVAKHHLTEKLSELLINHPQLTLKIIHGLSREINEAIISMRIDIGIIVNPVRHPDLIIIKLRDDEVGLWHHKDLVIDKKNITLICDSALNQTVSLTRQLEKEDAHIGRMIETNNFDLILQFARQKVGVAILPQSLILSQDQHEMVQLFPELKYRDEICLVYRHENRMVKAIQAIASSLKNSALN